MILMDLLKIDKDLLLDEEDRLAYCIHAAYIKSGRLCIRIGGKWDYLSRILLSCPKDKVVDHKNGNTKDNRKENLRVCTQKQNSFNGNSCSSTGYKGVTFVKKCGKFKAQITVDGKNIQSHLFRTAEAAAQWYDEQAIKYQGEYAKLNNVEELLS